jgi:hypothetical protein
MNGIPITLGSTQNVSGGIRFTPGIRWALSTKKAVHRTTYEPIIFDARICFYTRVYLHLDGRRSEFPPDLTMTKITG